MKKLIDILMIVWLTILIVNLFSNNTEENLSGDIIFKSTKNSYTTPASVELSIKNNSEENISINTCDNIKINSMWEDLIFDDYFCKDIEVKSWEEEKINYSEEYSKFFNTWNYIFKINILEKEYLTQFEINNPWTFRKIFTSVFYAPIYNLLIYLIWIFWWILWWSIIILTIIIRFFLIYPQHKMMVSQNKLQWLQPKIKEIQEKFKWQQQVIWVKLMELYKKEKVNPMGSCWFLLIQMPILLVLYRVILSIKDVSNWYYLYPVLSNFNLNTVVFDFYWLDLLAAGGYAWFILALSVWIIQFIQIKLSFKNKQQTDSKWVVLEKKKDKKDYSQVMPDTETINKFMQWWMPVMVAVFTFNLFAWVWVYWWISTLFMLFQQLVVNTKLKKSK